MKTSALLKLHQRQVDLLDMIVKASNRINNKKSDLNFIRQSSGKDKDWYEFMNAELKCTEWIERTTAIKERLIRYYLDIQQRITAMQPTIELNTISEMDLVTVKS